MLRQVQGDLGLHGVYVFFHHHGFHADRAKTWRVLQFMTNCSWWPGQGRILLPIRDAIRRGRRRGAARLACNNCFDDILHNSFQDLPIVGLWRHGCDQAQMIQTILRRSGGICSRQDERI
ncbi:unnamed protein product [Calypogeia fissa]